MREKSKMRADCKKVAKKMAKMMKRIAFKIKEIELKMERKMKKKQTNNIDFFNRLMLQYDKVTKIWSDLIYTKLINNITNGTTVQQSKAKK